jgi:predicted AlkP superfamily pyrophosphatase or phosphodiesterase
VDRGWLSVMLTRRSLVGVLLITLLSCSSPPAPSHADPILILVSIDGFRWDYLDRFAPPTLLKLAAEGVRADGLIPQFPSKTFPNHYTIVTGLTLAHHGIISNNIRDAAIPGEFSLSNRRVQMDPRWWGGEPIWNAVERQGGKAAPMFWPGAEVVIGGRQATYWTPYYDGMPHLERLRRILDWLQLPDGEQPAFLTMYFSDVDDTGHRHGPDSQEVRDAVARVDQTLGELVAGVTRLGLANRVHYVIVSDHGMAALSTDRSIVLDDYVDLSSVDVVDWSPVLGLAPKDGDVDRVYAALKDKHPALAVYRSRELPPEYGLANHPRVPPIVGVAQEGWSITSKRDIVRWAQDRLYPGGAHGYDNTAKSMQGLFIAAGPRIHSGKRVPPIENIHLYEFMCAVLGLQPAKNDGDPAATRDMLR